MFHTYFNLTRVTLVTLHTQIQIHTYIHKHIASEGHCSFLEDVSTTFIGKADPKDHQREHYWRHTLKTMAPLDLNAEDD